MSNERVHEFSVRDEILHALTHGAGIPLSIAALTAMVISATVSGDPYRIVSVAVFGATMVLLYSMSTLYHSFQQPRVKGAFRILDHSCIFLLIAGTYTPFTLVSLRGPWGWSFFGVVWGLALCGIIFKVLLRGKFHSVTVAVYIAMGWLGLIAIKPVLEALPLPAIVWLTAGGLMYTLGVVFYGWKRLRFHHAVWHLFVLAGTACHFITVYLYVLPQAA